MAQYTVQTGGSKAFNGAYAANGTNDGKVSYSLIPAPPLSAIPQMYWVTSTSKWYIGLVKGATTGAAYSNPETDSPPPQMGWVTETGLSPAPQVIVMPTPAQLYQGLSTFGGRPTVAWTEILRILAVNLPGLIDYANAQGSITIPPVQGFRVAPELIDDKYINTICVAASAQTFALGTGGNFRDALHLTVYWVRDRIAAREQVDDTWDGGALIRVALSKALTNYVNPDGLFPWELLEPIGMTCLPHSWSDYSGVGVVYRCQQQPGQMLWPVTT